MFSELQYYYSELTILSEEGKKEERLTSNQPIMVRSVIFLFPSPSLGKRVLPPSFVNVFHSFAITQSKSKHFDTGKYQAEPFHIYLPSFARPGGDSRHLKRSAQSIFGVSVGRRGLCIADSEFNCTTNNVTSVILLLMACYAEDNMDQAKSLGIQTNEWGGMLIGYKRYTLCLLPTCPMNMKNIQPYRTFIGVRRLTSMMRMCDSSIRTSRTFAAPLATTSSVHFIREQGRPPTSASNNVIAVFLIAEGEVESRTNEEGESSAGGHNPFFVPARVREPDAQVVPLAVESWVRRRRA